MGDWEGVFRQSPWAGARTASGGPGMARLRGGWRERSLGMDVCSFKTGGWRCAVERAPW